MRKGPFFSKPLTPLEKGYVAPESTTQKVDGSGVTQPVSGEVTVTGVNSTSGLSLEVTQQTVNTRIGSSTETAPGTDTASSGLNGRLQRVAQNLTTLIGFFKLGQGTKAESLAVTIASDQDALVVSDGGGSITIDGTVTVDTSLLATAANQTTINNQLTTLNSLVPTQYDYIDLSYTGSNVTTVVYKLGGVAGTTVSTLTLAYDGNNNLISVTKS